MVTIVERVSGFKILLAWMNKTIVRLQREICIDTSNEIDIKILETYYIMAQKDFYVQNYEIKIHLKQKLDRIN